MRHLRTLYHNLSLTRPLSARTQQEKSTSMSAADVPSTAKAVQLSAFTFFKAPFESVISIGNVPVLKPGSGEALVRLTLRPVNPVDIFACAGIYHRFQAPNMPATPGMEGMGVVAALGPDTQSSALTIGQRVTALSWGAATGNGTWQQYCVVKADALVVVPDEVTDEFAASAVVNPLTVLGLLHVAAIPSGENLLVTSAGSALNRMLLQLAKKRGIKVIGVVRREAQRDEILALGAAGVVVSEDGSGVKEGVEEITGGKGVYAAFDCISGPGFKHLTGALSNNGTIYIYGLQGGAEVSLDVMDLIGRGVSVKGFNLDHFNQTIGPDKTKLMLQEALSLAKEGTFQPLKGQRFVLDDVLKALAQHSLPGRGATKIYLQG